MADDEKARERELRAAREMKAYLKRRSEREWGPLWFGALLILVLVALIGGVVALGYWVVNVDTSTEEGPGSASGGATAAELREAIRLSSAGVPSVNSFGELNWDASDITSLTVEGGTAHIGTDWYPDDEMRAVAKRMCQAVLVLGVPLDGAVITGQGGKRLADCP